MNPFVETLFQHLVDHWEKQEKKSIKRLEKSIRVLTPSGREHVYEWMENEEQSLLEQFPELQAGVIRHTLDRESIWYSFSFDTYTYAIAIPPTSSSGEQKRASCYLTNGFPFDSPLPLSDIRAAFKQWVNERPEHRLRFVTGELVWE